MMKHILTVILLCFCISIHAQNDAGGKERKEVYKTFNDTRVINAHSVETLRAGMLDFRVGHRFGDLAGSNGGWETFYGLENASDVLIDFEYGITDRLMIGLSRANGGLSALIDESENGNDIRRELPKANVSGLMKYRLATQNNYGAPFSIALLGIATASTQKATQSESNLNFFGKTAHRFSYHGEFIVGRKISPTLSFQLSGSWTYRNLVPIGDKNDVVSAGIATRVQLSKAFAIIVDGRLVLSELRTTENGYYSPLGIGLEWQTGGGHVFQINLTNATGLVETDYIPYTRSNWGDGEFRLGFTIGRQFKL